MDLPQDEKQNAVRQPSAKSVTAVIPCLNEAETIEQCVDAIVHAQGIVLGDVLVVDGGSTDGTREVLDSLSASNRLVRTLDNPRRHATAAFNIGIEEATSPYVVFVGAHSKLPPLYLETAAQFLNESPGDVVCAGGAVIAVPRNDSDVAIVLAKVLGSPFGAGVSGFHRTITEPTQVDSVPYAVWRRSALQDLGGFDERLPRSGDWQLYRRATAANLRCMLLPGLEVEYLARGTFVSLLKHSYSNGYWVGFPYACGLATFKARHFLPASLALGLTTGVVLMYTGRTALGVVAVAPYVAWLIAGSVAIARGCPARRWKCAMLSAAAMFTTHVPRGAGIIGGTVHGAWKRVRRQPPMPTTPTLVRRPTGVQ